MNIIRKHQNSIGNSLSRYITRFVLRDLFSTEARGTGNFASRNYLGRVVGLLASFVFGLN